MPTAIIETDRLGKCYGSVTALADCTLTVRRGEIFGLLGPNGSGKTTLLRLLMGFLRPTTGRAQIGGLDCHRQSVDVHRLVSYLPGDVRLFRQMRGRDVLRFFSRVRRRGDFRQSLELAERLDLELSRKVAFYSTGMRQKLALAACLAVDAPLLILDEPTSNLDPTIRGEVLSIVREVGRSGRSVIFSSHVLSESERVCQRVVILRNGRTVHTQALADLRRRHRISARLCGQWKPPPSQLAGELAITNNGDGRVLIETPVELSSLLGWLAQLPLEEIKIEPVGLQSIYDRYHPATSETQFSS